MTTNAPTSDELAALGDDLYRFALSISRDPHLAADLVQDTFVRALERGHQFRGDAPLLGWLRRILHNLAIDRARRSHHEVAVEDVEEQWRDDSYTVDPAVVAERAHVHDELEDALSRLPFIYRTAVVLHDVEEWPMREVAELLDIGLPAAKQRLRRGRMMLVSTLASGAERRARLEGVPMRCWDARRHVSDYLDAALSSETAELLESHLSACPTCPPLYAALVDAQESLSGLRDSDAVVPPTVAERINGSLRD